MRSKRYVIWIMSVLCFVSCAHKSGHKTRKAMSETISNKEFAEDSKERLPSQAKLDGATIFRKYNNAVFMVYTSDGENVYQGSGRLIESVLAW